MRTCPVYLSVPVLYRALALVVLLTLGSSGGLSAQQTSSFVWNRYDVDISLRPDGTFDIVETQGLDIRGTLRRGYREIPLNRIGGITEVWVEEPGRRYARGNSEPYTFAVSRGDGILRVDWWFQPTTNGTRTFIIRYRVDDAIRVYPEGDQLYWTAIWPDRPAAVRSSTVTVRFPSDVTADQLRLAAYPADIANQPRLTDSRTVTFSATNVPADPAVEVRVQFPHGLVAADPPAWQQQADWADWYNSSARPILNFIALLATLAILAVGGVVLAGTWFVRGQDPGVGKVPRTLDEPPGDLPAGVVGTLIDEHADVQDVVATLVDLANRGVLRITEVENPRLVGSSRDYRIDLLKEDTLGLRPYEKTVITTLFRDDEREVLLSDLNLRFNASIPLFQDQLHAEVARAGLFVEDPERARRRYRNVSTALLAIGLLGGLAALFFLSRLVDLAVLPFVGLVLLGAAARWTAGKMPQRTRHGALEAARWAAFGRYLRGERANGEARRSAPTAEIERWMPYAVALGADQTWVRNLASVGAPPPPWYNRARYRGRGGGFDGPPIVFLPGPGGWGHHEGGGTWTGGAPTTVPTGGGPSGGRGSSGGPQDWSDSLADLLNDASGALGSGGGSDWSGGGDFGGGGSGGGGGGFE
jgi:hypothetical protein